MKQVILVFLLLAIVFSSRTSPQQNLDKQSNLGKILKKTSLGSGLISMVNLFARNKQDANEEEWKDLFEALDLLKETLLQKQEDENKDFESDGVEHEKEVARITALLTEYEGNQATLEFTQASIQEKHDLLDLELRNQQGQLDQAVEGKEGEEKYLQESGETFESEQNDYSETIALLNKAIETLKEAYDHADAAGFVEFVQVNKDNYQSFSIVLEHSMKSVKHIAPQFLKPVTDIFVSLKNESKVEPSRIQGAIDALQNLIGLLSQGMAQNLSLYTQDTEIHQGLISVLEEAISQLSGSLIPATNADIASNAEAGQLNQEALDEVNANIEVEEGYLADENESWEQRIEINDLLIPKLQSEYEIVVSAEEILANKQPIVDAVEED